MYRETISLREKQQLMLMPKSANYSWMHNFFISFHRTWWTAEFLWFLWESEHPCLHDDSEKEFRKFLLQCLYGWHYQGKVIWVERTAGSERCLVNSMQETQWRNRKGYQLKTGHKLWPARVRIPSVWCAVQDPPVQPLKGSASTWQLMWKQTPWSESHGRDQISYTIIEEAYGTAWDLLWGISREL